MSIFGFFYILSAILIMPSLLFDTYDAGVAGAIITLFATVGMLAAMTVPPLYFRSSLKTAVKILRREI
jgi:hypothetical protein